MKLLHFARLTLRSAFIRWALREIDPMHPDLPGLVVRQVETNDKLRKLFP